MTRACTKFSADYLKNLEADLAKIEQKNPNKLQLQSVKRKLARMVRVVDEVEKGLKIHEQDKKDYMEDLIELVKKRDINTLHNRKKITTVPWETGKALYEKKTRETKKRKKKQ